VNFIKVATLITMGLAWPTMLMRDYIQYDLKARDSYESIETSIKKIKWIGP